MIRQRTKNLVMAGVVGFILSIIIMIVIYLVAIRGNPAVINRLLGPPSGEVQKSAPEPVKVKVYTVLNKLERGERIVGSNLQMMEVDQLIVPQTSFDSLEQLDGQVATVSIEPLQIITQTMVQQEQAGNDYRETVEIYQVDIPSFFEVGDKVNLRIHFPPGQDYLLLYDKQILFIDREKKSIFLALTEEEILAYSSGKEDVNQNPGTQIYLTRVKFKNEVEMIRYPYNLNVIRQLEQAEAMAPMIEKRKILDQSLIFFYDTEKSDYDAVTNALQQPMQATPDSPAGQTGTEQGKEQATQPATEESPTTENDE